jgi:hypothetical protein
MYAANRGHQLPEAQPQQGRSAAASSGGQAAQLLPAQARPPVAQVLEGHPVQGSPSSDPQITSSAYRGFWNVIPYQERAFMFTNLSSLQINDGFLYHGYTNSTDLCHRHSLPVSASTPQAAMTAVSSCRYVHAHTRTSLSLRTVPDRVSAHFTYPRGKWTVHKTSPSVLGSRNAPPRTSAAHSG